MDIRYFKTLASTNDTAKELAVSGAKEFLTVVADEQTKGRGRMGREFVSPIGGAYFSTLLRPTQPFDRWGLFTPFAAYAVRRALLDLTGVAPDIKWVNDLLVEGKKICGILAESSLDKKGGGFLILGFGINIGNQNLPAALSETAGCLPYHDRDALIRRVLFYLCDYRRQMQSMHWLDEYRSACAFLGKRVEVIEKHRRRFGIALDITETGALSVCFEDDERAELQGGEISLRGAQADTFRHNL